MFRLLTILFFICISSCSSEQYIYLPKKELKLSNTAKQLCATLVPVLQRQKGNLIKSIISRAPDKKACADILALEMHQSLAMQKENVQFRDIEPLDGVDYDVVVVGVGIHSAIFNVTLDQLSQKRVLAIDRNKKVAAHFASDFYLINSPENTPKGSANEFPNAPLQLRDFVSPKEKFVIARSLWDEIIITHFASSADYIFDTTIDDIKRITVNNKSAYKVSLKNIGNVITRKIVISTGLGDPKYLEVPEKDFEEEQRNAAKNCEALSCVPKVLTVDELLELHGRLKARNIELMDVFENKKIALVGAGDASNTVVEFLFCRGPRAAYVNDVGKIAQELVWIGQKQTKYDEFKAASKPRYVATNFFEHFYSKSVCGYKPFQLHFNKGTAAKLARADSGRVGLTINNAKGALSTAAFDYVILAMGYTNNAHKIVAPLLPQASDDFAKLFPYMQKQGSHIARRLKIGNAWEEIYVIGAVAMPLATKRQLADSITNNAASINVLGPLTVEFAEYIAGNSQH